MLPKEWADKINLQKASAHHIAARVLAHTVAPDLSIIEKDENGRPYFTTSEKCLSLSHSGDFAAVIISDSASCGIDIEKMNPRVERIKCKFVRDDEKIFESYGLRGLFKVWCAKETLYKFYAVKKLDFKQHLRVSLSDDSGEQFQLIGEISKNDYYSKINLVGQTFEDYIMVYTQ